MSGRHLTLLVTLLMLGGCALLPPAAPPEAVPKTVPASPDDALRSAAELSAEGQWSEAVALLDAATGRFPDDQRLAAERETLQARWDREVRMLEDRIMVGDAENQRNKITHLEKLSRAQPDNLISMSRRIYWKEVLAKQLEPLTACAEFHAASDTSLARRCFDLASELATTAAIEQRLAGVNEQLRASENTAVERRRAREAKARQQKAESLLADAKQAIEEQHYRRALDILEKVAELQPDNREVPDLQQEAWSMISPQVEALIKLGDRLYLNEQLDAAVGTWRAALTLKPNDEEIMARIERARTVLNRLETLREQQRGAGDRE
jgi:tetratricopeptide (TPR) repeat protein